MSELNERKRNETKKKEEKKEEVWCEYEMISSDN